MNKFICCALITSVVLSTCIPAHADQPGFAGEDQDSNTVFLRDRYYDPQTGTFITKDPMGVSAGVNQYQYVANNPTNNIDPNGDNPLLISGGIGALIGGGLGFGITYWKTGNLSKAALAGAAGAGTGFLVGSGAILIVGLEASIGATGVVAGVGTLNGLGAASNNAITQYGDNRIDGQSPSQAFSNINGNEVVLSGGLGTVLGAAGSKYSIVADAASTQAESSVANIAPAVGNLDLLENSYLGALLPDSIRVPSIASNQQIIADALNDSATASAAKQTDFVVNQLGAPIAQSAFDLGLDSFFEHPTSTNQEVGGVLIDKAATLVGTNLSDIKGATFDPVSKQLVFLGSNNVNATTAINMDYFYTAVQAVYGSAQPPFVTLDPPATPYTQWTNFSSPGSGTTWQTGQTGGFILRYNPLWDGQDVTTNNTPASVAIRIRASWNGTQYDFTLNFAAQELNGQGVGLTIVSGGRYAVNLVYTGTVDNAGNLPSGIVFNSGPFTSGSLWGSLELTPTSQDSYFPVELTNNTGQSFIVSSINVIPAKQHRQYGGRVDGTKLGWVMYEADRVMKCLSVGKDNLTGAIYSSQTIGSGAGGNNSVPGYQNLLEISQANSDPGGNVRMWFEPNDMTLQRYVDPTSGQATVVFQSSTVQLLTESYLQGLPQDPAAQTFATFFSNSTNYAKFAALNFPVEDPTDPTGQRIIQAPIFALLQQAMQAVTLARFFRDNNIPLDRWWLNSYQPPVAYSLKSTPTAITQSTTGQPFFLIYGGVQIQKTNGYVPSTTAQGIGQAVTSARPSDPSSSPDLQMQSWNASTSQGTLNAVSTSLTTDFQDGNVNLAEPDLSFASPGDLPLTFTRYYESSYVGTSNLGPGWRSTRYVLQFSNPSWYDQTHIMKDGSGNALVTDINADTRLRTGALHLVDLSTGAVLDFQSSLGLAYATDSLGNPYVAISGLTASDVPTFTAGQHQAGATLTQTTDSNKYYIVTLPDKSWMEFDNNGNLIETTDRHSYSQNYAYDSLGRLSTITDSVSQVITLSYNSTTSLLQTAVGPATSGSNNQQINYNYDSNGRLSTVVQNASNVIIAQYAYNSENQLSSVTKADGLKPVTSTADSKGRSNTRVNYRGNSTTWAYSAKNTSGSRVTDIMDSSSGLTWERGVDSSGRSTYMKDPLNNFTLYNYTGNSPLPNGIQPPLPSDVQGNPASRPAISIARNTIGLPTSINDPAIAGGQPINIQYTSSNLPTHMTDTAGHAVDLTYTPSNNPLQLTQYHNGQAVGSGTVFGYQNESLHTVTDPMGHQWTYNNDTLGRLMSKVDPTGVTTSYDYDSMGRLWHIHDPKLSSAVTFQYDTLNRPSTVSTPSGTVTYNYDPVTKWVSSIVTNTTDGQSQTVQYHYNNQTGDVSSSTTTYQVPASQGGGTQSVTSNYGYTSYGNLQSITPPGAQPVNYNYNSVGQLLGTSETNSGLSTGPSIVASNASSGVWTNQNSQTFTWSPPTSSLPVTGYNFAEDASTSMTVNTTNLTVNWNNVSDGQHTFHVRATDSAGNWSPESTFNLWVDTVAPAVSIVSVTPNPIPQGNVTVTITATVTDAGSGLVGSPALRWCVSSDSSRPWSSYANMNAGSGNQWSGSFVEPGSGSTLYYQIQTQDAVGNIGIFNGSMSISGPSGNDGPLMPPLALALLAVLFFGVGNWLVNRKAVKLESLHK